ncbi:hypothetical protein LTS02_009763 [Friedmanniomyces endolithicus]|nr:hypothetical protein LTS02_009763 [Friedmanniomyces endolithicus]
MTTPEDSRKRAAWSITMPESVEGAHKRAKGLEQDDAVMDPGTPLEEFYDKSEFLRIEDVARDFYTPDLHNAIDPMYQEKNFAHDIEYKYIEMSARLATRYLQTAETWSAIDKIVNTRQKDLTKLEEKNDSGQNHYAYPSASKLTLAARQQGVQNALAQVARTVRFLLASATDLSGSTADTTYVETVPGGDQSGKPQWHGEIRLDKQSYRELVACTKSKDDPVRLLILQWQFATSLIHESTHAICFTKWTQGNNYNEKFFDADATKAPFAEAGFEVEHRLFGGIMQMIFNNEYKDSRVFRYRYPDGTLSRQQGKLVVFPWPNNTTWNIYKGRGINRRPQVKLPKVDLVWRVDVHQLASHFRTSTWNKVAQSGIKVLHLDRTSGHGFWQDPTDKFQVLQIRNPKRADLDADYEIRAYGDVMRKSDDSGNKLGYADDTAEPDSPLSDEDQFVEPSDNSTDSDSSSSESDYDPMDTEE